MSTETEAPDALLTYEVVRGRVEAAIEAKGRDYVNAVPSETVAGGYEVCRYFEPDGSPSCIVGQALATELTDIGVVHGSRSNTSSMLQVIRRGRDGFVPITLLAVRFLYRLQMKQDRGATWGDAYDAAVTDAVAQSDHLDDTVPALNPYAALDSHDD